jgi:hypothetical protein
MLPLRRNLGRQESLNLGVNRGTRQEQALWSDPLVRRLFISLSLRQADGKLHVLHGLPYLQALILYDCGLESPLRCVFPCLTRLELHDCVLDASACPPIRTLTFLGVYDSKVLLAGAGHPFPLVSWAALSLRLLFMENCEVIDVAGTGQLHIDAPWLCFLQLSAINFHTSSKTCSLAGPHGVSRFLWSATVEDVTVWQHNVRYARAAPTNRFCFVERLAMSSVCSVHALLEGV